jgi:hypothetical protein
MLDMRARVMLFAKRRNPPYRSMDWLWFEDNAGL